MANPPSDLKLRRFLLLVFLLPALIAFLLYYLTAFRTITWWDSGEYSLASVTLGIPHPPGSLLTTLFGWFITMLPLGLPKAHALNLFSGFLAAIVGGLVSLTSTRLFLVMQSDTNGFTKRATLAALAGGIVGATAFLFGKTLWLYAVKFTPYVLTAVLTACIVMVLLRWWERAETGDAIGWLCLALFLFGLDFSIHRTNLLLFPGVIVWILLRRPAMFSKFRNWVSGVISLMGGLAVHLLIIPISMRGPVLNMNNPSNFSRFWDYITLKQYGGGWLVSLFPRKAPFWGVQVKDYIDDFTANFFTASGPLGVLGLLPLLLGIIGLAVLFRRNLKLATGFLVFFLLAGLGAVLYFNMPANFFRPMDRHYLPSFVISTIFIAIGAAEILKLVANMARRLRPLSIGVILLVFALIPASQILRNYRQVDGSRSFFAHDSAANILGSLPPNSIFFFRGDNETWPIWYLQFAEGIRADVAAINLNLMYTSWYMDQLLARFPDLVSDSVKNDTTRYNPRPWNDSTIAVKTEGHAADFQLPEGFVLPDSIYLKVPPSFGSKFLFSGDWFLLKIITNQLWKRPIYFSTAMNENDVGWISPYLRLEGAVRRIVPATTPPLNPDILTENLLERYVYRGYADPSVPIDDATRWVGCNLCNVFLQLAWAEMQAAGDTACVRIRESMLHLLPPERLNPPEQIQKGIEFICK